MSLIQDLQKDAITSALIELYIIDTTPIGGSDVFYLTPNTHNGGSLYLDTQEYIPFPISGAGWETSVDGKQPQPTLLISNVTQFINSYLTLYEDLVGAKVTRMLTLEKYLAHGSSPDPTQIFSTQVFVIHQMTGQNKTAVEFKLSSLIDRPGRKFPREQVLRNEFPGAGLLRRS